MAWGDKNAQEQIALEYALATASFVKAQTALAEYGEAVALGREERDGAKALKLSLELRDAGENVSTVANAMLRALSLKPIQ
jgi:hypothetical protein